MAPGGNWAPVLPALALCLAPVLLGSAISIRKPLLEVLQISKRGGIGKKNLAFLVWMELPSFVNKLL